MTGLLRVELRRILARRLVHLLGALALLGILIGAVVLFARTEKVDRARQQALEQEAQEAQDAAIEACIRGEDVPFPPEAIPPGVTHEEFCHQTVFVDYPVESREFPMVNIRSALLGVNVALIVVLAVLGASLIGAEWHSGSIVTLLTWEPRRLRVMVAKVVAVAVFVFVASVILQVVLALALVPSAVFHGTTAGADAEWVRQTAWVVLRGAAAASLAAAIGFSLASIGRNTAAALGFLFAYIVILEQLLGSLRPGWRRWLLTTNLGTFVQGEPFDFFGPRSALAAGLLVAGYAVGMVAVAAAMFSGRDVA